MKRLVALVAFFTVMGTAVADASEPVGQIVQFDSAARGVTEKVSGYLSFPSYASGKVPLMLVLHSTGGIGSRDWDIVRKLNAMGVATFVVDSFGSRNLKDVYKNKLAFNQREQLIDALSALKTLQADDRIDTTRLGSMGRSMGGETSLRLTLKASRDRLPIQAPAIALALAITPGCMAQERDATMTAGSEAHFFLADRDFSPYEQCVGYAQKMNKDAKSNNKSVSYKIYHGTFHVFDQWQKPVWSADQEVYAGCPIERYGSGHLVRRDTHQELRTKAEQDRFYRDCVTRGGWVGGSPERVTELDRDWSRLVDRRFFVP